MRSEHNQSPGEEFWRYDWHTHTDLSDGRNDLQLMALSAIANGMKAFAVTDHAFSDEEAVKLLEAYRNTAPVENIKILHGVESCIVTLDGISSVAPELLAQFDLVLMDFNKYIFSQISELASPQSRLAAMLRLMISACRNNPEVDIMAHPFNFGNSPIDLSLSAFDDLMVERIAEAFLENGKVFEIMNQMYFWHQDMPFDSFDREYRRIVGIFKKAGVAFSWGSDAHSCCGIGNLAWARGIIEDLSLQKQLFDPLTHHFNKQQKRSIAS